MLLLQLLVRCDVKFLNVSVSLKRLLRRRATYLKDLIHFNLYNVGTNLMKKMIRFCKHTHGTCHEGGWNLGAIVTEAPPLPSSASAHTATQTAALHTAGHTAARTTAISDLGHTVREDEKEPDISVNFLSTPSLHFGLSLQVLFGLRFGYNMILQPMMKGSQQRIWPHHENDNLLGVKF